MSVNDLVVKNKFLDELEHIKKLLNVIESDYVEDFVNLQKESNDLMNDFLNNNEISISSTSLSLIDIKHSVNEDDLVGVIEQEQVFMKPVNGVNDFQQSEFEVEKTQEVSKTVYVGGKVSIFSNKKLIAYTIIVVYFLLVTLLYHFLF